MKNIKRIIGGLLCVGLLAGCSSGAPSGLQSGEAESGAQSGQSQSDASEVASATIPDSVVGTEMQRVIDILNDEADTTEEQWDGHLTDAFIKAVSAADLVELFNKQLRPAKPFKVTNYFENDVSGTATVQGAIGDPMDVSITVAKAGQLAGLLFSAAADPNWEAPKSLDEATKRLEELPGDISILVTKNGEDIVDIDSEELMPLGSIFKLYVLLAVADAVKEGTISWDDELTVTDAVKSLPTGELQDEPEGTKVSVEEAASKMITVSDNTATDMLIDLVGRGAVENAVVRSGHSDPEVLKPFVTTKELFSLAWDETVDKGKWKEASITEKESLLEKIDAKPFTVDTAVVAESGPVWPEGLDWFASARDIAAIHKTLADTKDEKVRAILSENPGVNVLDWDYAAFKGGSIPGVLTGSWLLEDGDQTATVVLMSKANEPVQDAPFQQEFFGVAQAVVALLNE